MEYITEVGIEVEIPVVMPTPAEFSALFKKVSHESLGLATETVKLEDGIEKQVIILKEAGAVRRGKLFCRSYHRIVDTKVEPSQAVSSSQVSGSRLLVLSSEYRLSALRLCIAHPSSMPLNMCSMGLSVEAGLVLLNSSFASPKSFSND